VHLTECTIEAACRYRGEMPGESYFLAVGALGLSLAGFAGLISALDQRPAAHSLVAAYRIRGIVFLGFSLTFAGFGTVALYSVTGEDLTMTARVASVFLALPHLRGFLEARPGPVWPDERERRSAMGILLLLLAVTLGNVVVASVGYLQLLMLVGLIGPVSIFYNTVREASRNASVILDSEPNGDDAADT
jgi:hypothetical protein